MSLIDSPVHRLGWQARLTITIRAIEDLRTEIMIAQSRRPAAAILTLLGEADFHLEEAQDELRRAAARIDLI